MIACDVCQRSKHEAVVLAGLLQPLPIPNQVWDDMTMNFIEGLPRSHGFDSILVVVDRLSNYSHFIVLKHPFTTKSVALIFLKEVVRLHGIPRSIISDQDKVFMSSFWRELFSLQGSKLKWSTTYNPQADGQSLSLNNAKFRQPGLKCHTIYLALDLIHLLTY